MYDLISFSEKSLPIAAILDQLWPIFQILLASMFLIKMMQLAKNGSPKEIECLFIDKKF